MLLDRGFYRNSARLLGRAFVLVVVGLKSWNTITGVAASVLVLAGMSISIAAWWQQYVRWWVPVGVFLFLFLVGLLVATYEENQHAGTVAHWKKRILLRRALAEVRELGLSLANQSLGEGAAEGWINLPRNLINDALGPDEVRRFFTDEYDWEFNKPNATEEQIRVLGRLKRIDELIDRLDSLEPIEIRPDFAWHEWICTFTELRVNW